MQIISKILLAAPMTVDIALKVLDLTRADLGDKDKLRAAWKAASYKHHPDKGGSTSEMQRVVDAYELLQNTSSTGSNGGPEFWNEIHANYHKAAAVVTAQLKKDFKPEIFQQYFESVFKKPFELVKLEFSYKGTENTRLSISTVSFTARWTSEDKETSFMLYGWTDLHEVVFPKPSLGGEMDFDKIGYEMAFMLDVLHDNHKHKLTKSNVQWTRLKASLSNPEILFPLGKLLKKMESKAPRTFRRSDFESAVRGKLGGKMSGTNAQPWAYIPFGDVTLSMFRVTLTLGRGKSVSTWDLYDVKRGKERVPMLPSVSMMESAELVNTLADLQKKADTTDLKALAKEIIDTVRKAHDKLMKTE